MVHSAADQQRATKKLTEKPRVIGRPFPRGVSGNPRGRVRGSKNRKTLLLEKLLAADGDDVLRVGVAMFAAIPGLAPELLRKRGPFSLRRGYLFLALAKATCSALCATARLQNHQSTDGGDAR